MRFVGWLLNLAIAAVILMGVFTIGPLMETQFLPVYAPFKIINVEPVADGKASRFTIEFRKLRDCAPRGYAWYTTDLGSYTQSLNVTADTSNPVPNMPVGKFTTAFTIDGVTAADIPSLYAETYSNCHPFWITKTIVFP